MSAVDELIKYIKKAMIDTIDEIEDEDILKKLYPIIMMIANPDASTSQDNSV